MALVFLDTRARDPRPLSHWLVYGIDPALDGLPEGISYRRSADPASPSRQLPQGRNDLENVGYHGSQPPLGPAHDYHFKLHALDCQLPTEPGIPRKKFEKQIAGHVIAETPLDAR